MNSPKTMVPRSESKKLLSLPTREAELLFQSYEKHQQLEILSATRNPKSREQLYYLVPDCTELIQESTTEDVLQVLDTMLGTGLASVLLPCLSNEQFEELLDIAVWRDGKLDEESLDLWLFELSECERDDLGRFLRELDLRLLATLLHGRITVKSQYTAMFLENELMDPGSPAIDYADERARAICDAIWEADHEIFGILINELADIDAEGNVEAELAAVFDAAKADRAERVQARDKETGIDVTEADLMEKVDLESLTLDEDDDDDALDNKDE
ncbi:MAG: DUF6178 family protein [Candidatus Poribacteria bacterium]|nr:DUF6178 family protein [Candidatus Poribacteria bacterium]